MVRRRQSFRSFRFEVLEDRQLLAGDVSARIVGNDLIIHGDDAANGISITAGSVAGTVVVTGIDAGGSATRVNGTANGSVTLFGFTDDLRIKMNGGADTVTITNLTVPGYAEIITNRGNDSVTITNSFFDELEVRMGKEHDNLSISGTTVRDDTTLKGGRGSNSLTTGSNNSLGDFETHGFTFLPNTAPTVDLNAVTAINENGLATLTGTFTDSNAGQTHTLVVDWGDANNSTDSRFDLPATSGLSVNQTINSSTDSAVLTITGVNVSTGVVTYSVQHRYADDGAAPGNNTTSDNSTITVTVSDGVSSASVTTSVTVNNVAPTITDPADTTVNEGTEVVLTTTITDPGTLDRFTATVNWGDGQSSADSIELGTTAITDQVVGNTKFSWNPTTRVLTYKHTYADDSPTATSSDAKTVTVTVRDDDATTVATQTTTVTVNNVVPTISDPPDTTVNEGTELTLSTTITDPGTQETFTATVNWGDGQTAVDSIALGTTTIPEQVVGNTKFSWNPTTRVLTYKHTYVDDNPTATSSDQKTVTVTVRDDDSTTIATQTTTVTVNNVLPTITDPADTTVNLQSEVTLSTTITDPGTLDAFTATVSWDIDQPSPDSIDLGTIAFTDQVVGDTKFSWNPTTKVLTYKHTYSTEDGSGAKTVTVTVRDDDSATVATQTTTVTVNVAS